MLLTIIFQLNEKIKCAEQTKEEKEPSSINGRIILKNPEIPDKQEQPPIIVAPQFVVPKHHGQAKMKLKHNYPMIPQAM